MHKNISDPEVQNLQARRNGKMTKMFHIVFYFFTVWDFVENERFG